MTFCCQEKLKKENIYVYGSQISELEENLHIR